MMAGGVPARVLLLLVFSGLVVQSVTASDLYWEGEEDAGDEFLEVDDDQSNIGKIFTRVKRQWWPWVTDDDDDSTSTTTTTTAYPDEEDNIDEGENEEDDNFGSGVNSDEVDLKEKTIRVSFVVREPYQTEFSNQDSPHFQNISKSLADAVNALYEHLPGSHRASLVRIQSLADQFACNVTLEIPTSASSNTENMVKILKDHIVETRRLGPIVVDEIGFFSSVFDTDEHECPNGQYHCSDGRCVEQCDGIRQCDDGADELNCNADPSLNEVDPPDCDVGEYRCANGTCVRKCDGVKDCDFGADEVDCGVEEYTTDDPVCEPDQVMCSSGNCATKCDRVTECADGSDETDCEYGCERNEMQCDEMRCVLLTQKCDGHQDCTDGADERDCPESCGIDDFRCGDGRCIEKARHCDRIGDCPNFEDEHDCECTQEEFRCISNGFCIESRKRCDGYAQCEDGSDEMDCATDKFRCRSGKLIPGKFRCNHRYDCPRGDYSDEKNCPCGKYDFQCGNGHCISASKHCDGTHDCQDRTDEQNCKNEKAQCMPTQYKCSNNECVQADARCNGIKECQDGSDERDCPCKRDEFHCRDDSCINIALRCNRVRDCPAGDDEHNCGCREDQFTCDDGSCATKCDGNPTCPNSEDERNCPGCREDQFTCDDGTCATKCDGNPTCPNSEDERNCPAECYHSCDGQCLDDNLICDGHEDCYDGSDEARCDDCGRPEDFRCDNGQCLSSSQRCNGIEECSDGSDERDCETTVTLSPGTCDIDQYQCRDGSCINILFRCDGKMNDCADNSDEDDCGNSNPTWPQLRASRSPENEACLESEFSCYDGRCIPHHRRCDNLYDCHDFSDEQNCLNSACLSDEFQCASGQCISDYLVCSGYPECSDGSDEVNCPTTQGPYGTTTTSRPAYIYTTTSFPYYGYTPARPTPPPVPEIPRNQAGCSRNQWRCENGPCIDKRKRCDGHVDCLLDDSDELDCPPGSPPALNLKTYPDDQSVRYGGDVVFRCRDEGPIHAPVRWVRDGGRPLKPGSSDKNGRLEMFQVTPSDAGAYICQAVSYLGQPGSEKRVILNVENRPFTPRPAPFSSCNPYEATCGNGQCIPKSAVCNGQYDCSDKSDETYCYPDNKCQPNEYQCANRRCVLKTWVCDSEDDCGDGSDENNCGTPSPGQPCQNTEFACRTGRQCVPKSYHCDKQNDCLDGSDEVGCAAIHITKSPKPLNVRLNPGDTLTLECEAVGIPTPLITWRLNWGHIPEKCISTSENGIGVLTCPSMQPGDSGAYSCEAINNQGTSFAVPDSIVYVNKTDVCPSGFFNSEASSPGECIRCFCFGESTQCTSADLYTYHMPTYLGQGGTRLVGVTQDYSGSVQIDSQPIHDLYFYQPLQNGVTVTKLDTYSSRSSHPYVTLPETYNHNQLTSYGGYIKYTVHSHSQRLSYEANVPDIIIKGKFGTLVHNHRHGNERPVVIEARLTPENWRKVTPRGPAPATREDIMMALDDIETILLRADLNGAGVNITDFVMESAQQINAGHGLANLVEQCQCPAGYEGLSCEKCASGYSRQQSGPWLGNCVRKDPICPPGTYGSPSAGYGCRPCPCPLIDRENNFARTCSMGYNGRVICDCLPGYEGANCESCGPGLVGNPNVPGDSCKPAPSDNCNPDGTIEVVQGQCECKENVIGQFCERCNEGSFFLSKDFRHGCARCFCSGVTQRCESTFYRRKTTSVAFNYPPTADEVKIYNSTIGYGQLRYTSPVETDLRPVEYNGELTIQAGASRPNIYYWSLPISFAGDKVTSYGGYLRYTLRNVPQNVPAYLANNASEIQLLSDNTLTFQYFQPNNKPDYDGELRASVQFLEKGWQRPDGKEVSREQLLLALADVKTILIKATYAGQVASLVSASIETAGPDGDGAQALHVEQCTCPTGYLGTSCEDCAPGYRRNGKGLYLEHCSPCDCNGHSSVCDPQTGVCSECADNTAGDNCEFCKPNYIQDRFGNCVPSESEFQPCNCDRRGEAQPCQDNTCVCKQNVEGTSCDQCRRGTFALSEDNVDGCTPCYCSGVTDECYEADNYYRVAIPAVVFGENNGGFTINDLHGENVINDHFVPATNESELTHVFDNPPDTDLYWSLPQFPGNRVLSYGGHITLAQRFQAVETPGFPAQSQPSVDAVLAGGDGSMLYWRNPNVLRSRQKLAYRIPLVESSWINMDSNTPASREEFMNVLKKLDRVLIRATLAYDMISTTIADVAMETAAPGGFGTARAKGVEVCLCPEGYTGTSCETCKPGYYQDNRDTCKQCNCNGHDCALGSYGEVVCQCRPPYTGKDCASVGGDSITEFTTRPPPPQSTVVVTIKSKKIRIEQVGGTFNITCQASSRMSQAPLTIYWSKDNGYLPQGRYYTDDQGLLLISNVQVSDSGRYICQASDGISTEQKDVTLQVSGNDLTVPTVSIKPPYSRYYEGDRIELECIARGNPTPTISWQRSLNRPLPFGVRNTESFLIIDSASVTDSGEYRCTATNAAGALDRTAVIEVIPLRPRPSYERLTISPSAANITEGQSTRLICTGTVTIPPGSIGWTRKDGTPLQSNTRSSDGILYIDVARLDNQGIYICQTANNEVSPEQVIVTVQASGTPSPSDRPSVSVNINRLSIPTGEMRDIECTPSGIPLPTVAWRKNGEPFGASTTQRDNTLIIANAQESDAGYYLCEGLVNGEPVSQVYVSVDIERREPPSVMIWPEKEQAVPLGSKFDFHCRVTGGIPPPEVTWERNGRALSPHVQLYPNNILRFEKVEVNDEGEYICTATNVVGSNTSSAVLKVRSPPQITFKPSSYVTILRGDPINIECRATGYPEPMVSITEDSSHREVQPPTPGKAALRVNSATERDEGVYTCRATSLAGETTEQFAVAVDRTDAGMVGPEIEGSGGEPGINEIPESQEPESDQPNEINIYEGADSVLTCEVSNDVDAEWIRGDRQPLQNNAVQTGYSLRILNASKSDEGYYECQILDRISHQPLKSKYTYIRVNPADYRNPSVFSPPRITLRPQSQVVSPGQSPRVECHVDGDDILEVVWRPVTKPFSRRVETRDSILTFHQIEVEDAGYYECFAKNRAATATAQAEVIVNEDIGHQPVESYEHEQFAHSGAAIHLSCNVTQPNLRISWTKDSRTLPRSITQKSDGSLFIRLAQKSDSGYYVCTITDQYGRKTTNYINLHIEGKECLTEQFRCYDDSGCIDEDLLCDGFFDCDDHSDEENCLMREKRLDLAELEPYFFASSDESSQPDLVSIIQPRRPFNVGDNVEVPCKARSRDVQVQWERVGTNQYLDAVIYGDGSILRVPGVEESDAGEYRCIGRDPRPNGRTSYDSFMLEVNPRRNPETPYPPNDQETKHIAKLHDSVVLPCFHDLEEPVHIEWRREFVPLPSGVQTNNPNLLLNNVTEKDAGTYVCRISNSMVAKEARAILQVVGVLPRFTGDSWLSLPTLKDAYRQFNIEISLKPMDKDGLILYNSQNPSPNGDFIALQLVEGVPEFILEPGNGPYFVRGDRPLQLNQWHTIRISRTHNTLTMTIDNAAPSVTEVQDEVRREWVPLDLNQPLYIGSVPDPRELPSQLQGSAAGFVGCVSLLILGRDEVNIMTESWERHNIQQCEVCNPNPCLNNGVCQEARNERGYTCLCTAGFAGLNCNRTGEACRPGLCGEGKCTDSLEGFKCSCPVTHTGKRCEIQQQIEYPAFTGSAYLAIKTLAPFRAFRMSMKVKPQPVVTDGIIMYCAESARGVGGFISLAVKDGRLQYRYDAGDGNGPVVLDSDRPLPANEWTSVQLSRIVGEVTLTINNVNTIAGKTISKKELVLETPLFVGGYDDSIILNNNTAVTGGFNGCIKDVVIPTGPVDIIHSSIQSANVQECSNYGDRGDIPENDRLCSQCRNNGYCVTADATACTCPSGFFGVYCEKRIQPTRYTNDPCLNEPCKNGGKCKQDPGKTKRPRYTCDCPLGYTGINCERPLELQHSVGFEGNGYLELPADLLHYDNLEEDPVIIALALRTTNDGILLYQGELGAPHTGDFILLRVEDSKVVMEWDLGAGVSRLEVDEIYVNDGERHQIIAELLDHNGASLSVDGYTRQGVSKGMSTLMNANSNIYIGGLPEKLNYEKYPGLVGCFEQVEFMNSGRGLNLGQQAATGWNTKQCRVQY